MQQPLQQSPHHRISPFGQDFHGQPRLIAGVRLRIIAEEAKRTAGGEQRRKSKHFGFPVVSTTGQGTR